MAVVGTIADVKDQINLGPLLLVFGTLTFSGNYVTGGELPTFPGLKTGKSTPVRMIVMATAAYQFHWDSAGQKLMVFQGDNANGASAPGIQLAAAAYPGALTGATTNFIAFFRKP